MCRLVPLLELKCPSITCMTWVEGSPVVVVDVVISCRPLRKREVRCACSGCSCRARRRSRGRCSATTRSPEPAERFLGYLASIEKSPNTVKAYAHDLKDWFTYLAGDDLDWQAVSIEDVAGFVAWLRLPPQGRDGIVAVLPTVEDHCSAASVNRNWRP